MKCAPLTGWVERGRKYIMTELWDAYDHYFNKIKGMTLIRDEPFPEGVYHLLCDVIVKHIDGSYLVMQRDFRKHHGGMWELTAGGCALQGEGPLECAYRELKEETGLDAGNLEELGRTVQDECQSLYVEYLWVADCPKDGIVLQEGETVAYKWVDRNALLEMSAHDLASNRTVGLIRELGV